MHKVESDKLRIMIADDHPMFREGLIANLQTIEEVEVVGEAENGAEAIRMVADLQPDIILMDVGMPEVNGIVATRTIVRSNPHIVILVLTMFDDDSSVFSAMKAGARGYLLKGSKKQEIFRAIAAVSSGEAIFSPTIASKMMYYFKSVRTKPNAGDLFPSLTEREQDILELIAEGLDNMKIAAKLALSLKTVRNNVSNILNKLQVTDRAQAILIAREAGLGQQE